MRESSDNRHPTSFPFLGPVPPDHSLFADAGRQVWTVSQLTARIKQILEDTFPGIWIEGEISNFRQPTSGHMYFTLKDEFSQISAVMFRSANRALRFRPEDGLAVIAFGTVTVYERRGEYQITVEYLEPKGLGALQLAFEQLKHKLEREGLFDPAHKKPLPLLPRKIGVVTSPTGAAIRDILRVLDRRVANVEVFLYPVQVQGETAAEEIAQGIEAMNLRGDIEVLIVGRGGGSVEDLWAFNEERVARAIYSSRIPIISAVGHETDFTIADFVADVRAPTPSAAAEMVVSHKDQLRQRIDELIGRLGSCLRYLIRSRYAAFIQLRGRLQALSPQVALRVQWERFSSLEGRLHRAAQAYLQARREEMRRTVEKLGTLSPLAILERGFSLCLKLPSLQVLRDAEEVEAGDEVLVRLCRGKLHCSVKGREK